MLPETYELAFPASSFREKNRHGTKTKGGKRRYGKREFAQGWNVPAGKFFSRFGRRAWRSEPTGEERRRECREVVREGMKFRKKEK